MNTINHRSLVLTAVMALITCLSANAQMLWPIAGAEAGEGIIYKPQQYLDDELVFDDLFITAPEGTVVLAPADGVLEHYSIGESISLNQSVSYRDRGDASGDNFDAMIARIMENENPRYPDCLSGHVTLGMDDGYRLHIDGLRGTVNFKTGMKICKGDTLGVVWRSYRKIAEPHIGLSISHKGKSSDPMSPFVLKTSFIPPEEVKIPEHFTAEQAREDLNILFAAYEELYPSKYDIMTPEQDSLFMKDAYAKVADGIGYEKFYRLVESSTSARYCHDSHLAVLTPTPAKKDNLRPHIWIGALGDSLIVFGTSVGLEEHVGKRVMSINGIPAEEYVQRAVSNGYSFDAANESVRDIQNITRWARIYGIDNIGDIKSTSLEFSDGSAYLDKWMPASKIKSKPIYVKDVAYLWNYYNSAYEREVQNNKFNFSQANDSTGVFTLTSFNLSTVQLENIADTLKTMSHLPNMIIDIRNNPGGDIEALRQLLTYLINETPVELHQYFRVNSNSTYPSLKYSQNYTDDMKVFEGYEPIEGKKGFYQVDSTLKNIMPDSLVNYKGRLYVLTGEETYSAASVFASYLVRNRRAVTVGRETASGYHWLTAIKFADIVLPNSRIQVRIPLVQSIFDDTATERTPLGRGLMPDYEVPLTIEEYWSAPNDIIMEKALLLIAEGKYLSDVNPFAGIDNPAKKPLPYLWIVIGILALAIALHRCLFRK